MTIEIASRLTALRKEHGYSQEELAEKLGVSRQAVSKWERAESSPDTDNLIALAKLYGVTLDQLVSGSEEPATPPCNAQTACDSAPADEPADDTPDTHDDPLPHGSYFDHKRRVQEQKHRSFPYPLFATVAYLIMGFGFHLWHPGWIIFLTIPLYYLPQSERSYLRLLGNPVMITIIYLLLGTMCNLWHPGWLIFLLIPFLQRLGR